MGVCVAYWLPQTFLVSSDLLPDPAFIFKNENPSQVLFVKPVGLINSLFFRRGIFRELRLASPAPLAIQPPRDRKTGRGEAEPWAIGSNSGAAQYPQPRR